MPNERSSGMAPNRDSTNPRRNHPRHMRVVSKLPMPNAETERSLCRRWIDHHDISAAHQLASSHLDLVVKIVMDHRGSGFPFEELIGEGHLALMHAVCRFDPDQGTRFATYATWWVQAAIKAYLLHNWPFRRVDSTASRDALVINLARLRARLQEFEDSTMRSEQAERIADMLQVPERDVVGMNQRMGFSDYGLNTPIEAHRQAEWQACS